MSSNNHKTISPPSTILVTAKEQSQNVLFSISVIPYCAQLSRTTSAYSSYSLVNEIYNRCCYLLRIEAFLSTQIDEQVHEKKERK